MQANARRPIAVVRKAAEGAGAVQQRVPPQGLEARLDGLLSRIGSLEAEVGALRGQNPRTPGQNPRTPRAATGRDEDGKSRSKEVAEVSASIDRAIQAAVARALSGVDAAGEDAPGSHARSELEDALEGLRAGLRDEIESSRTLRAEVALLVRREIAGGRAEATPRGAEVTPRRRVWGEGGTPGTPVGHTLSMTRVDSELLRILDRRRREIEDGGGREEATGASPAQTAVDAKAAPGSFVTSGSTASHHPEEQHDAASETQATSPTEAAYSFVTSGSIAPPGSHDSEEQHDAATADSETQPTPPTEAAGPKTDACRTSECGSSGRTTPTPSRRSVSDAASPCRGPPATEAAETEEAGAARAQMRPLVTLVKGALASSKADTVETPAKICKPIAVAPSEDSGESSALQNSPAKALDTSPTNLAQMRVGLVQKALAAPRSAPMGRTTGDAAGRAASEVQSDEEAMSQARLLLVRKAISSMRSWV